MIIAGSASNTKPQRSILRLEIAEAVSADRAAAEILRSACAVGAVFALGEDG